MKKSIIIACISLIACFTIQAQPNAKATPEERAQRFTKWMTQQLNLDESQASQVEAINLETAQKMKDINPDNYSDRQEVMEARKTINEEQDKKMKAVLTEEQMQKYLKKKKELHERRKGNRRPPKEHLE